MVDANAPAGVELRPIARVNEYYAAGSDGFVYTRKRQNKTVGPWKRLGVRNFITGYLGISMLCGLKLRTFSLHRVICTAFHGLCPAGHQVRHLDGDRHHNRPDNLRWGTHAENMADRARHGTVAHGNRSGAATHPEKICRGAGNGRAILTEAQAREIFMAKPPLRRLRETYGVSEGTVTKIRSGALWAHKTAEWLAAIEDDINRVKR